MPRKNQGLINFLNMVTDAVLVFGAYFAAMFFRFTVLDAKKSIALSSRPYLMIAAACAVLTVLVYWVLQMYGSYRFKKYSSEILTILFVNGMLSLTLMAYFYLTRIMDFPRLMVFFYWLLSSLFVIVKRFAVRAAMQYYRRRGHDLHRLLLVGDSELAARYAAEIRQNPQYGCVIQGYLAPSASEDLENHLGDYDQLRAILEKRGTDEVVITMQQLEQEQICDMIALCGRYSAKVSILPAFNDYIPSTPHVEQIGSLKLLNVRSTPDKGPVYAAIKRSMDIVASVCGLILASPIMLATAIAIKKCDGGPAIFSQIRAGKDGKEFKMYKFRSMYIDAEKRLQELLQYNESDGPTFKIENDPRITKVGRFIRRTSIDELPQLLNILQGDMSLVGPRPPLPREVAQYSDRDWGRLAVKPGLTCYWQISGRSNLNFDEWMRLDLKYVEEQGLWTDIRILWKTVGVVLRGDGAY